MLSCLVAVIISRGDLPSRLLWRRKGAKLGTFKWSPQIGGASLPENVFLSLVSTLTSGDIAYRSSLLLLLLLHKSTSLVQGLGKTRCRDSAHPPPLAGVNLSTVFSGLDGTKHIGWERRNRTIHCEVTKLKTHISMLVHSSILELRKYDTRACNTLTWLTTRTGPTCCSMSTTIDSSRLVKSP